VLCPSHSYNDEEYESLLQFDPEWSKAETDHLFDLLARFDLRFVVVQDRWMYQEAKAGAGGGAGADAGAGAATDARGKAGDEAGAKAGAEAGTGAGAQAGAKVEAGAEAEDRGSGGGGGGGGSGSGPGGGGGGGEAQEIKGRTIEEMKTRYYAVARRLLEARADNPEEAASHPIIKSSPFNAQHEVDRKLALSDQMERTNALEREEQAILDEVKAIEGRRRAEAQALSARAGAAFSSHRMEAVKMSIAVQELQKDFAGEAGVPSLPTAEGPDVRPPPGVYARGAHVIFVAGEISAVAVGAGGARGVKRIETAVEELGVKAPQVTPSSNPDPDP